jgi:hypothetical protein
MTQQFTPEDREAVDAFLRAGLHLTPEGDSVTLNTFRKHFKGAAFSARHVLNVCHPDIARNMEAASLARVIANGRRIDGITSLGTPCACP